MPWISAGINFLADMWGQHEQNKRQEDAQEFNSAESAEARAFNAAQAELTRDFNKSEAVVSRDFNSAQAVAQRDWTERMDNTKFQRMTGDMREAGLNPMLSFAQHPTTPSGAAASGSPASSTAASGPAASSGIAGAPSRKFDMAASMQTASQIQVNDAIEERTRAEADKTRAEELEIKERTPTHQVTRDKMKQEIEQSVEMVKKIMAETTTQAMTAVNIDQQTKNLKALIPQIEATVDNLKAHTKLHGAQTGLAHAQAGQAKAHTAEINQKVAENLPKLEAALLNLQRVERNMAMPGRAQDESVQDSYLGSLGATLRALNPFNNFFSSIPSTTIINRR